MKLTFNCDSCSVDETLFVEFDEKTEKISVGETIDILSNDTKNLTIYTKPQAGLMWKNFCILFLKRFLLCLFNMFVFNFRNKWYEEMEPFVLLPLSFCCKDDLEIKYVPTQITSTAFKIEKRKLFINNRFITTTTEVDKKSIALAFVTHACDLVSLALYSFILTSVIFIYSGVFYVPVVIVLYAIITSAIIISVFFKIRSMNKEKAYLLKILQSI